MIWKKQSLILSKYGWYISIYMAYIKEILISEKDLTDTSYKFLKEALGYIKNNLIHSDVNMYLKVDSLITINSKITCSNNITLRKVNLKPYGID